METAVLPFLCRGARPGARDAVSAGDFPQSPALSWTEVLRSVIVRQGLREQRVCPRPEMHPAPVPACRDLPIVVRIVSVLCYELGPSLCILKE